MKKIGIFLVVALLLLLLGLLFSGCGKSTQLSIEKRDTIPLYRLYIEVPINLGNSISRTVSVGYYYRGRNKTIYYQCDSVVDYSGIFPVPANAIIRFPALSKDSVIINIPMDVQAVMVNAWLRKIN